MKFFILLTGFVFYIFLSCFAFGLSEAEEKDIIIPEKESGDVFDWMDTPLGMQIKEQVIKDLEKAAIENPDPVVRERALRALLKEEKERRKGYKSLYEAQSRASWKFLDKHPEMKESYNKILLKELGELK